MRGTGSGSRIRALFVIGGNPVTALGEPETTLEAFRGLDLLVTVDPSYTETAALSDFYVPTTLPYEHADFSALQDAMFEEPFVQVTRPQVEPPATVLDDWEFFWELNHRLGIPLTLQKAKVGGPVPASGGIPVDMETKPTTEGLIRLACAHVGLDYDELLAHPSGMVVDRPPIRVVDPDEDNGERLDVLPPDVAEEVERYAAEAKSARPLLLVNRRLREVMNGAFHGLRTPAGRTPYNPAHMNLEEMHRRGVEAGDLIAITSDYGEIVAVAEPDPTVGPGVVSIAHQWSDLPSHSAERSGSSFTGRLVSLSNHLEAVNCMPRQSAIPVSVARVET
jgi:anaerobic selenocysteine-containing dehydrogenase